MKQSPSLAIVAIATIAISALDQSPALAAQERRFGHAGGFNIVGVPSSKTEHGMCVATLQYKRDGETQTSLARSADPEIRNFVWLAVTNSKWAVKNGKTYRVAYYFDSGHYVREAVGDVTNAKHNGYLAGFPAKEFMDEYAKSYSIKFHVGDKRVEELSLKGSSAAMREFEKCWEWLMETERKVGRSSAITRTSTSEPTAQQSFADSFKQFNTAGTSK